MKPRPIKPLKIHLSGCLNDEFRSFDWGKFKKEVIWGSFIFPLGAIFLAVELDLSTKDDWQEHPVALIAVALLPLSIVIFDAGLRVIRAIRRVYRERPHPSFRDAVHTSVVLIGGWVVVVGGTIMQIDYVSSPHLAVTSRGQVVISEIRELPKPNTSILFTRIRIENSGVPSTTQNWRCSIKSGSVKNEALPVPDSLGSHSEIQDQYQNRLDFSTSRLIYVKTSRTPVSNVPVEGWAEFVIVGANSDFISQPGTKLTVLFDDAQGHTYSLPFKIPSKESTGPIFF